MANPVTKLVNLGLTTAHSVLVLWQTGLIQLRHPIQGLKAAPTAIAWGVFTGGLKISKRRHPNAVGIIDERGPITFKELDKRSNSLARAWTVDGLKRGSRIGVLARDNRYLVDVLLSAPKIGAKVVLLNTGFSGPQLAEVAQREGLEAIVYDEEFAGPVASIAPTVIKYLGWADEIHPGVTTIDALVTRVSNKPVPRPKSPGSIILLTSGTTGLPKGAPRTIRSPFVAAEFLDRVRIRQGEMVLLGAPLFHATGLSQFAVSLSLGCTIVLRRRFDPRATLETVQKYKCAAVILVPTMLQRIIDLGDDVIKGYDTTSIRIIFLSGSSLSAELGNHATALFGDVIHNLYGSTEVSVTTVATPADWKLAPGTVGRAPHGCHLKLFDDAGHEIIRPHVLGRIFSASQLSFKGYTNGTNKEIIDGLLSSGDIGHFDEHGLLFIDGRDDDMIVSGGENVYPVEIEELIAQLDAVNDAAVIGVPDAAFGQRLKAFVVLEKGKKATEEEIKDHVKANLARYKVPREVVFVDELPRNPTGKLLRRVLT